MTEKNNIERKIASQKISFINQNSKKEKTKCNAIVSERGIKSHLSSFIWTFLSAIPNRATAGQILPPSLNNIYLDWVHRYTQIPGFLPSPGRWQALRLKKPFRVSIKTLALMRFNSGEERWWRNFVEGGCGNPPRGHDLVHTGSSICLWLCGIKWSWSCLESHYLLEVD